MFEKYLDPICAIASNYEHSRINRLEILYYYLGNLTKIQSLFIISLSNKLDEVVFVAQDTSRLFAKIRNSIKKQKVLDK